MLQALADLDLAVMHAINRGWHNGWLDNLMSAVSWQWLWIVVAALFVGRGCYERDWAFVRLCGLMIVLTIVADAFSHHWMKPTIGRLRPCQVADLVRVVGGCAGKYGFPSNHATNGAVVATIVWAFKGWRWGFFWASIVALIGLSRVYLGVHYPSDVLGGFVVGASFSGLAILLVRRSPRLRSFFVSGNTTRP